MLHIAENNSQSCNLEQCFGDLIATEGTNANGAMPNRQHMSATPSPRATYTPTFQNKGQIWKTMVSQLELPQFPQEEGGQVQCFGDLIPMEGTNAKWCHAKSAANVRDAKPEGDVHSNLPKQRSPLKNRDLTLWRFGFRVREIKSVRLVASSATGLIKKKKWCETMYGKGLFAFCFQT